MAKPRMTNDHKTWVRDTLIHILSTGKYPTMSHDDAVAAVTTGSVPMYVDVCRRIVKNCPFYAEHHRMEVSEDWFAQTAKAFGEWVLYKAGVRKEETKEEEAEDTAKEDTPKETTEVSDDSST